MNFIYAFLFCGLICAVAQFFMDKFKLLPIYLTVIYVCLGSFLELFNLYDILVEFAGGGALVPISSFGHSLTHAAVEAAKEKGFIGLFTSMFSITSSGIACAIFASFIMALIFKPRG